ncbi:hypothetical protein DVH05_014890 [Phytophthora capsici]|nr:hypothetical protein DVH05_014890 [Phytophthora capsici]
MKGIIQEETVGDKKENIVRLSAEQPAELLGRARVQDLSLVQEKLSEMVEYTHCAEGATSSSRARTRVRKRAYLKSIEANAKGCPHYLFCWKSVAQGFSSSPADAVDNVAQTLAH